MKAAKRALYLPQFVRVQFAMIMREMATTYGKSYFGYVWAVLDPIGAIAMLSLAFSLAFRAPALGEHFPLFYATGYMPFLIYVSMEKKINGAIRENKKLLFYPRVTYIDAIISRFILNYITQMLVAIIVFGGIILIFDTSSHINTLQIFFALLVASILGLGIGVLNSVIVYLAPSWKNMWGIITRPLFLTSCIFYLYDTLPTWAQDILWYNPIVHLIGLTRKGIFPVYDGDYVMIMYPLAVGIITLLLGLLLLRRQAPYMINS